MHIQFADPSELVIPCALLVLVVFWIRLIIRGERP